MRILLFCFAFISIVQMEPGFCQCPDRDSILHKLNKSDKPGLSNSQEDLTLLLGYEKMAKPCLKEGDSVYALLLQRIGELFYSHGEYLQAIQYEKRAIGFDKGKTENYIVRSYYDLYRFYDSLGLVQQKNDAVDSCISKEIRADKGYFYTSIVLTDRVLNLYYVGDYIRCFNYAALGEKLIPEYYHTADSTNYIVFFITYEADALFSLNDLDREEKFLLAKQDKFLKQNNNYYLGIIYGLLGFENKSKKNYKEALYCFDKCYQYDLKTKRKYICSQAMYQSGMIYFEKLDQPATALNYYHKALQFGDRVDSFYVFGNVANVYAKMNYFDSAHAYFQKAFDQIKPGIDEKDLILHIEDYVIAISTEYIVNVVLDKGDMYLKEFRETKDSLALKHALQIYHTMDRLLGNIRAVQAESESKLFWRGYALRLYEHAIQAAIYENSPSEAFYFFEKNRAVLLIDQLVEGSRVSSEDILSLAQYKKKIAGLERLTTTTNPLSSNYTQIQRELLANKQGLDHLEQRIKNNDPLYYQNFFDTSFISLQDVRNQLLTDHVALLELFAGDSGVYVLLITNAHAYLNKIDKNDFDSTVDNYVSHISNASFLNSDYIGFGKAASHLQQLIFQNYLLPAGRVIISPDGRYFPFEALIMNADYQNPEYFIKDYAVSYTYSARYLLNNFSANSAGRSMDFLGIAPIQYNTGFKLNALPGSEASLNHIGAYFKKTTNLIAGEASKNNFLKQFANYKIIQFYTHATDSSSNREPVIYFADSALYLSELILESKPVTQLVVLSACQTGNGKLYQGEGVFSFNRGFASLGIPAAISNLWSVDNLATYSLTELFYKYLSKGQPTDMALQKAKIEFQDQGSNNRLPYYWAAPILAGKTNVIEIDNGYFNLSSMVLAGLAVLLLLTLLVRKKRVRLNSIK
jgi:CHAT domain-containing protein